MRRLEAGDDLGRASPIRHDERRVGALVAQMQRGDAPRSRCGDALRRHLGAAVVGELGRATRRARGISAGVKRRLDRLLAQRAQVGEAHAIGREHAGQRMDRNTLVMPSASATQAGMLPAGAAEAAERVFASRRSRARSRSA